MTTQQQTKPQSQQQQTPANGNGQQQQPQVQLPPSTVDIHYVTANGWPCVLTICGANGPAAIERANMAIKVLEQAGARPGALASAQAETAKEETEREAPLCKYHGPMKESTRRPGSYFCPHKMGDGSYCKEKA